MKRISAILILFILLLSACNNQEPTPTPEPATAVPPTAEPTEAVAEEEVGYVTDNPWQWVSFTSPVEQFDVETPDRYRILFNDDGTVNIVADCNNASGEYEDAPGSFTITVGPSTLAVCTPDSRSDQFITYLGSTAIYFFEDGNLLLDLMADGGTMVLAPSDNSNMVAEGEGDIAPPLFMDGDLVAAPWQWVSFTNPVEQFDVETPEAYLLQFNEDNTVNIVADCNNASGSFTLTTGFSIEVGPMTMAACPPESLSDQFVAYLGSAANYFFEDGNLYIDLMADGGTMVFVPASSDAMGDDGEGAIAGSLPDDLDAQLDAFLQSQIYTEGGNPEMAAPGMVLLVDTPNGRYLNAAGVANLEDGTPMQVDDILEIGSNTKSMTIVLLMQLVEDGVLTLEDTLDQWLPEQAALFEYGDQITLRQLAQHTAGLWDYGDEVIENAVDDPALIEAGYTPEELVQYAAENGTPYFAPGEEGQWHYSNTGYMLLGMILEKATGQSLTELYQTRIFDPLELESAVLIEGVPQAGEITTHGYIWSEQTGERVDSTNWNASQGWAAGAVAMTAADLATYGHALSRGEFFQNPETLADMLTFDQNARFGVGAPYGLGLFDVAGDGTEWGHAGQTLGFQSLWFTDPEAEIVVVGLTNSASYPAYAVLNVRHILQGEGAQPLGPLTLLPIGGIIPTTWIWTQFVNPAESVAVDAEAGLTVALGQDQSATVKSAECGSASGAYSVDGTGQISFDLDDSAMTCDADSLAGQFVQHLKDATRWHFANGDLIIELPADGGSLILDLVPVG